MTFTEIITESRRLVKQTSDSYSTDDIVSSANSALERIVPRIREAQGRWQWDDRNQTSLPFSYTDLANGIYDYTTDPTHLAIQKVEAKNADGGWYELIPFDINDVRCGAYSSLLGTSGQPQFVDKMGQSLILTPTPNFDRTAALRVFYERGTTYFTSSDTTKEPGFNKLFHRLIPLWCAYDYALINTLENKNDLRKEISVMEKDLENFYARRDRGDRPRMTIRSKKRFK